MTKNNTERLKIYFSNTGLACYLARVHSAETLKNSYLKAHMVETYIISEIIKSYKNNHKDVNVSFYYYRAFEKEEIDLLILGDGKLSLIECKAGEEYSKDDIKAFTKLKNTRYTLNKGVIICTSHTIYPIGNDCYVIPISAI